MEKTYRLIDPENPEREMEITLDGDRVVAFYDKSNNMSYLYDVKASLWEREVHRLC